MRPYIRKIIICLTPVLLSLWAIWYAWQHDRFKLGVDLSGGTILVYEIDLRKQAAREGESGKQSSTGKELANRLAERLKKRIDPNDLYNIVIRPAGEGRVEIILPTGGPERAERADQQWRDLVADMEKIYLPIDVPPQTSFRNNEERDSYRKKVEEARLKKWGVKKLEVNRGRVQELAEQIQKVVAEHTWQNQLYNTPEALKELIDKAQQRPKTVDERPYRLMALIDQRDLEKDAYATRTAQLAIPVFAVAANPLAGTMLTLVALEKARELKEPEILKPLKAKTLRGLIDEVKRRVNDFSKERGIEIWFKEQAWAKVRTQLWEEKIVPVLKKEIEDDVAKEVGKETKLDETKRKARTAELSKVWSAAVFKARKAQIDNVLPDSFDELIGRAVTKGDSIGQAFVNTLSPVMRGDLLTGKLFLDHKTVADFLVKNYGPSLTSIEKKIEESNKASGRGRDLTVEEVQRIKELVPKVGSLEFRILANSNDDKAAIDETKAMIAKNKAKLEERQKMGLPPPAPSVDGTPGGQPKVFLLDKLPRGATSKVTYEWVELGKQERQQLRLQNASENQSGLGGRWFRMKLARDKGEATELPENDYEADTRKLLLQGALFYSRRCESTNLPEEERRQKKYEYFVLTRNPEIDSVTNKETPKVDGSYLIKAESQMNEGRPAVSFRFNAEGGRLFRELTRKNIPNPGANEDSQVKRHLAIILDGLVVSAPTINSEIYTDGQISGSFTPREVDQLVDVLRSGELPATLKAQPVSESTLGATLGQDTIEMGIKAIVLGFLAVMVFMIVYYRFAGLVASVALLANLIITVGFMVVVQATFTLPGLAGLVLMVGMAVDANVLIYERLREERERGASLSLALRNGYDRAFPTIIDTHLTSIFVAIVLYVVGNDQLKGFGVTLTVGLLISLFTSLYMTRLIFDIWNHMGWLKKLSMFRLFSRPDIDFMGIRYYWFTVTILLTILGMALFIGRLPNDLNIDFVGGTAYAGQLNKPKNIDQLRILLDEEAQEKMLNPDKKLPTTENQWPKVKEIDANQHSYLITYKGFAVSRTVNLANAPKGDSSKAREENVQERARVLPDVSIEQIYSPTDKEEPGLSRYFNVRTSEREPELVQASLDQLLQEKDRAGQWESLLKKIYIDLGDALDEGSRSVKLDFYEKVKDKDGKDKKVPQYASPSFVRTLFNRELFSMFKVKEQRDLPFQIDLTGEGQTKEGRFEVMKLTFSPVSGNLTKEQKEKIRTALTATQQEFSNRPQPERLETFDSQLANDTRLRAMYAILLSWGAILVYLWFRFGNWTFGLAAVLCLIHDLFFTLGIIAACHFLHGTAVGNALLIEDFKIDLTAVAALLTLVGYSVNDTIVVFDRIREVRGKNPDLTPQMINDSVNQTLSRTILTSLVTWLVVIVLYIFGGPGVHLFAFVMVVGVIVGTYSSIYIASPLLLIFGEGTRATAKPGARDVAPTGVPDTRIQPAQ